MYGEYDSYISEELREQTVGKVRQKRSGCINIEGLWLYSGLSPWEYDVAQNVYHMQIAKLKQYLP